MNQWQGPPGYNYDNYNTWNNQLPVHGTVPNNPAQLQTPYYNAMPVSQPIMYAQVPGFPQPQYIPSGPPVETSVQYYQYQQQADVIYLVHPSSYSSATGPITNDGADHRDSAWSRSRSRSRERENHRRSRSPYRNQQSYRSPDRNKMDRSLERERNWSRSPDWGRKWTRSPSRDRRLSISPEKDNRWSRSPDRNQRWSRSPSNGRMWSRSQRKKRQQSRSPGRNKFSTESRQSVRQSERRKKKVSKESKDDKDSETSDIFKRLEEYKKKFKAMKSEEKEEKPSQSYEINRSSDGISDDDIYSEDEMETDSFKTVKEKDTSELKTPSKIDDDTMLVTEDKTVPENSTSDGLQFQSEAEELINEDKVTDTPFVGLQYITEVIHSERRAFICSLCKIRMIKDSLMTHIAGYIHQSQYFKRNHEDVWRILLKQPKCQSRINLNTQAQKIEKQYGRQRIVCVSVKDYKPQSNVMIPDIEMKRSLKIPLKISPRIDLGTSVKKPRRTKLVKLN